MFRVALMLATLVMASPAAAQRSTLPAVLPNATSDDEIIVNGLRIPREKLPTAIYWDYPSVFASKIARENADMFFRCALKFTDTESIRRIIDGEPNSATARQAQGWITTTRSSCYPPERLTGIMVTKRPISVSDLGSSTFDRGVIIEQVLNTYAPDAALTAEVTLDPAVKDRFERRESVRNRLRLPVDRDALIFASCLVKQQPVLATRLFRSAPGSMLERGLTQTILIEGRSCLGRASRVTIDPSLTRLYIIDAFYRWVVAARGVDSLIPADV